MNMNIPNEELKILNRYAVWQTQLNGIEFPQIDDITGCAGCGGGGGGGCGVT